VGDVEIETGVNPDLSGSTLSTIKYVNRKWNITESAGGLNISGYTATSNSVASDVLGGANTASLKAGKNDNPWIYPSASCIVMLRVGARQLKKLGNGKSLA
jgi:hypothetical protein